MFADPSPGSHPHGYPVIDPVTVDDHPSNDAQSGGSDGDYLSVLSLLGREVHRLSELATAAEQQARAETDSLIKAARAEAEGIVARARAEAESLIAEARQRVEAELQGAREDRSRILEEGRTLANQERDRIRTELHAETAAIRACFAETLTALDRYLEAPGTPRAAAPEEGAAQPADPPVGTSVPERLAWSRS